MFFILARSTDGGKTWEDQFEKQFKTGQEAQANAKEWNDYYKDFPSSTMRFRVRKVLDTDDDNFMAREEAVGHNLLSDKLRKGSLYTSEWQFVHFHPEEKTKVRYFQNMEAAVEGKWTTMNLSRFLSNFSNMSGTEVATLLVEMGVYENTYEFHITQDAEEIQYAYEHGPTSCMNDPEEYELCSPHPTRVYAGPDLALAYIKRGDDITARAVVWPEKQIFYYTYGHEELIESELVKRGYSFADADCWNGPSRWVGARLPKIECDDGGYIMPYLDISCTVDEEDEYFITAGDDGNYNSTSCNGRLNVY